MSILERYQQKLDTGLIDPDPIQNETVQLLQQIQQQLQSPKPSTRPQRKTGILSRWLGGGEDPPAKAAIKGVYLWGGVGRGKTWLMDQFFKTTNIREKQRHHFNRFMLDLHQALKQHPDQEDPLKIIAHEMAQEVRLLCLDELHLTEITNAALLYPMLENLMLEGIVVVATSNRHPEELYQGTLHASRFKEPTRLMMEHMHVINLDNGIDYRIRRTELSLGEKPEIFARTEATMARCFDKLSTGSSQNGQSLMINGRAVQVRQSSDNVIWFDFHEICETTRTTSDYIWLSERYEVMMISGVPVMDEGLDPAARRFFYLVDELYDRKVRFIFTAESTLDELYEGHRLKFPFKRTLSRLMAMHIANRLTC